MKSLLPILVSFVILFSGCKELIDYSPFDLDVDQTNVNNNNLYQMQLKETNGDSLSIAVFSDSHSYYDNLKDAISSINSHPEIQFAICCGDITESGLSKEYNWYYKLIKNLKCPVITAIGNHDYLSNGLDNYYRMFGPTNFSFYFNNYRFIIFDDIVWENKNQSPNFKWLQTEMQNDTLTKTLLVSHIPPWSDQIVGTYSQTYSDIISHSKVILNLHGHLHNYAIEEYAGRTAIVTGSVIYRTYNIITLYQSVLSIKQVSF